MIEGIVLEEVSHYLDTLKEVELSGEIAKLQKQNTITEEQHVKSLKKTLAEVEKKLGAYKDEIAKAILGESAFDKDLLGTLIQEETQRQHATSSELEQAENTLERKKLEQSDLAQLQQMIPVWREEFEHAPHDVKKVLLSKILEKVIVYPERVEIVLRMQIEEFLNGAEKPRQERGPAGENTASELATNGGDRRPYITYFVSYKIFGTRCR